MTFLLFLISVAALEYILNRKLHLPNDIALHKKVAENHPTPVEADLASLARAVEEGAGQTVSTDTHHSPVQKSKADRV